MKRTSSTKGVRVGLPTLVSSPSTPPPICPPHPPSASRLLARPSSQTALQLQQRAGEFVADAGFALVVMVDGCRYGGCGAGCAGDTWRAGCGGAAAGEAGEEGGFLGVGVGCRGMVVVRVGVGMRCGAGIVSVVRESHCGFCWQLFGLVSVGRTLKVEV